MPKELTHILIARDVLKHLKGSAKQHIARVIEKNLPAFYLGAIIPDAFFYDVAPFRKMCQDYVQISRALHLKERLKNDQKAVSFFDAIAANPHAWHLKAAFAAGIVTHTVSDRIIHGVIDHYTIRWRQKGSLAMASHRQLETLIDMLLMQQLHLHPRDFRLKRIVDVNQSAEDCLFRFYLTRLIGDNRTLHPRLIYALRRAHAQQCLLLKLFTVKPLYHIMYLSNKLVAGRLGALSGLFYPRTVGTRSFPLLNRLDLNALTNGRSFTGTLASLIDAVTTDAICHVRVGLYRLGQGE
ncbi:MAG: zinc dependent phospholipase C family protein [Desulfobacterales bacterium]|nr:zinc dependent phospholipase C family protein [Desulfobacterales bacterium]